MGELFESGEGVTVHRIDADDRIVAVNDVWVRFARDNGDPDLGERAPERSLWEFITGDVTTMLWREVIARVREGRPVSLPYRCDAPEQRREFLMRVVPLEGGGVEFTSTLTRSDDREPIALLERYYGAGEPIRSCSWCRRFDAGGFVEVEVAIVRLGLLGNEQRPITHTICDECVERVRGALAESA